MPGKHHGTNAVSSHHALGQATEPDWAQLLTPVSSADPSGPNLEYSVEFAELELLACGTPDRQMGAALTPGQAPDPAAVLQRGLALLRRTKDVRALVHLLGACSSLLGIAAFVSGLGALRELLERFWDTVHPQLDPDDEERATARANATMACASPELVRALRRAVLLDSRSSGHICLEDALLALREVSGEGEGTAEVARIRSVLREQPAGILAALVTSLQSGYAQTIAITSLFTARSVAAPDLQPLQRFLQDALSSLRQHGSSGSVVAVPHAANGSSGSDGACDSGSAAERSSAGLDSSGAERLGMWSNSIANRDDVLRALEQLCQYYHAQEPASPLPLLLRRCQRLVGLDFVATLRELAPEALTQLTWLGNASHEAPRS